MLQDNEWIGNISEYKNPDRKLTIWINDFRVLCSYDVEQVYSPSDSDNTAFVIF